MMRCSAKDAICAKDEKKSFFRSDLKYANIAGLQALLKERQCPIITIPLKYIFDFKYSFTTNCDITGRDFGMHLLILHNP